MEDAPTTPPTPPTPRVIERWFFARGLTSLLADTGLRRGAAVRSVPWLVVTFVITMLFVVPALSKSPTNIGGAMALSAVSIVLTWVGANLARRRPPFAGVSKLGLPEALVYILVPTVLTLVIPPERIELAEFQFSNLELRVGAAIVVALLQTLLLGLIWLVVGSGIISIGMHMSREVIASFASTTLTLTRTLPVLLGVVAFFFFTNEMWQSVAVLPTWPFLGVISLFVLLSLAFLSSRNQIDIRKLSRFNDQDELAEALVGTPFEGRASHVELPQRCSLNRRQSWGLRLTAVLSRFVVASMVAVAVFLFFMVFGLLLVDPQLVKRWTELDPLIIMEWNTRIKNYGLTWEHIRISTFLAVFSGFYFSVVSATDPMMRQGVRDTAEDTIREACAMRLVVLADEENSAEPL